MFRSRKIKFYSLLLASVILAACGGGGSSNNPQWKTVPLLNDKQTFIRQVISNDSATITLALFKDSMIWIDDAGQVLANKAISIDPQLLGNEEMVENRSVLVQRNGAWMLRSFVQLASGDQRLVFMPVDFESGYTADSSGFLPGVSVELDRGVAQYSHIFELSNGHWLFVRERDNSPILDMVAFSAQGELLEENEVEASALQPSGILNYWVTSSDELRIGNAEVVYSVQNGQLHSLWNTARDCGVEESFFNDFPGVPIRNATGEALLGCGNDQLIRIQTDGSVLKYPVELPADAVTLMEANYIAQPGGDLWLAATYSPTPCNEDGSCTGALFNSHGVIKRYSLDGTLEIDNTQMVPALGFIGTIPNAFILEDGAVLFLSYQGDGGYTLVDQSGIPRWSAFVPAPFLSLNQTGPAFLAPSGHLYLASGASGEIYRFNTAKR